MIESLPKVNLYIKSVLREVHHDEEDLYITKKLISIVCERILNESNGDESPEAVSAAMKRLGSPVKLGRELCKEYKHDQNGLMLFNRTIVNLTATTMIMVAAFIVYRLFPQKEYVCYLICAIVSGIAAWFGTHYFYKLRYHLIAMFVPAFLLSYYPIRDAVKLSSTSDTTFFQALFSSSNRTVLTLIAVNIAVYAAVFAFLYFLLYSDRNKGLKLSFCVLFLCSGIAIFGWQAYARAVEYNASATACAQELSEKYSLYFAQAKATGIVSPDPSLLEITSKCDALIDQNIDIYIKPGEQTHGSLSTIMNSFDLYSSSPNALISYYHPAFSSAADPDLFDKEALQDLMLDLCEDLDKTIRSLGDSPDFKEFLNLEIACRGLLTNFTQELAILYRDYIFSVK